MIPKTIFGGHHIKFTIFFTIKIQIFFTWVRCINFGTGMGSARDVVGSPASEPNLDKKSSGRTPFFLPCERPLEPVNHNNKNHGTVITNHGIVPKL